MCHGAKQENKSEEGPLHLVHVTGQGRRAAMQRRSCRCGTVGRGKETLPLRAQEKHELSGGASTTDWAKQKLWGKSKGLASRGFYRKARKASLRNGFFFGRVWIKG